MVKRSRALAALLAVMMAAVSPALVRAQGRPDARRKAPGGPASAASAPAPAPSAAPAASAALEAAKDFFRQGNARLEAGETEAALELFRRSREQVPSISNTNNEAICLEKLGRTDEALDRYEQLLTDFAPQLSSSERTAFTSKITALRAQVGQILVSSNVAGQLSIDGRRRGVLPLAAPIRVRAGRHEVRVTMEGYESSALQVDVPGGQSTGFTLELKELSAAGRLRVIEPSGAAGVEVLVDGAPLGLTPWEGTLGPGRHLVVLRGPDVGSGPTPVTVLVRQTVTATIKAEPLGPAYRVSAEPATAVLSIDGVEVGPGVFEGRLPLAGKHSAEAREEGYFTETAALDPAHPAAAIKLLVDEAHPRWRQVTRGKLRIEPFLGLTFGAGFGSDPEGACIDCTGSNASKLPVQGGLGGARIQYEFPAGLRLGVGGGYLKMQRSFQRAVSDVTTGYTLSDKIEVTGPFAMVGVAYPWPRLSNDWRGLVRLDLGVLFASVRDPSSGQASGGGTQADVNFAQSGATSRGVTAFVMPGVGAEYKSGKFSLGLGISAAIFLLDGPRFTNGELGPVAAGSCPGTATPGAACGKGTDVFGNERSFSRFVVWVPSVTAGLEFLASFLVQGGPLHDRSFSRSQGRRPRPGGVRPPRGGGLGRALLVPRRPRPGPRGRRPPPRRPPGPLPPRAPPGRRGAGPRGHDGGRGPFHAA
jgi:hypothetical protein